MAGFLGADELIATLHGGAKAGGADAFEAIMAVAGSLTPQQVASRLKEARISKRTAHSIALRVQSPKEFWSEIKKTSERTKLVAIRDYLNHVLDDSGPIGLVDLVPSRIAEVTHHPALKRLPGEWAGESLLILGPTGCGKSAAAVDLVHRWRFGGLLPRGCRQTAFWTSGERLLLSQRRHPLGRGEPPEYESAVSSGLLVVDDPDWISARDADELFALVCAARERTSKPMIVTSNSTREEFIARYTAAVFRRVKESSRGPDGKGTGRVIDCYGK